MKFLTNEVKIALAAIVGIVILFAGMQFLKGLNAKCHQLAYTAVLV